MWLKLLVSLLCIGLGVFLVWYYIHALEVQFFLYAALFIGLMTLTLSILTLDTFIAWLMMAAGGLSVGGISYFLWHHEDQD